MISTSISTSTWWSFLLHSQLVLPITLHEAGVIYISHSYRLNWFLPQPLHLTLSGLTPSMVILLTKHSLVCEVLHDKPQASREDTHQDMEVKEEGCPCGRLVL